MGSPQPTDPVMSSPRDTRIAQISQAARSLSPLDYVATVGLAAIYAIGTSLDDGPGTRLDFYRSAATVIPTLLVAVAIQGRVLELSTKLTFARRYRTVLLAIVLRRRDRGPHDNRQRRNELGGAPVRLLGPRLAWAPPSVPRPRRPRPIQRA